MQIRFHNCLNIYFSLKRFSAAQWQMPWRHSAKQVHPQPSSSCVSLTSSLIAWMFPTRTKGTGWGNRCWSHTRHLMTVFSNCVTFLYFNINCNLVILDLYWLQKEFLGFLKEWEGLRDIDEAVKKRMCLSKETVDDIKITGTWDSRELFVIVFPFKKSLRNIQLSCFRSGDCRCT